MSNLLSFYIDDSTVQAMNLAVAGGMITAVHDARTFPHEELDAYLASTKLKECIVCCNPTFFYQDTYNLPPAAAKFYQNMLRAEVQKSHPELQTFTFFYHIIGDATIDGVLFNRVAVFSYADESVSDYISLFNIHGKTISGMYAAPYPIFRLAAASLNDPDNVHLVIASIPNEKLILLSMRGEPAFIRSVPSTDVELNAADSQNISMTIDYCFQSLRVRPAEALLVNLRESFMDTPPQLGISLRFASLPPLAAVSPELTENYIAPLAGALHYAAAPSQGDITPATYITFKRGKKALAVATLVLVLLSVPLCGLLLTQRLAISDTRSAITAMRGQLAKTGEELDSYRKLDDEAKGFGRQIEDLNKLGAAISPAAALAPLSRFITPVRTVKRISTQKGEGFIGVHLEGDIQSNGYDDTQRIYEDALASLIRIPGYSVTSSSVDIAKKSYIIEARFSGGAEQPK